MPHYCKICGEYKSNESFSGGGHASHICKKCKKLPVEVREKRLLLNRISSLPYRLSKKQRTWLEKLQADPREAVRTSAEEAIRWRTRPRRSPEEEYFSEPDLYGEEYDWLYDEGISPDPDWVSPEDEDFELPF